MKAIQKYIGLFILAFFSVIITNAQSKILKGTITAFDSIAIFGAEIKVQSSKVVVLSDTMGNFTVECETKDKIIISAKGFFTEKVPIDTNIKFAAVNLKIKPGDKNIEYAIGYGKVSDRDKMGALAKMSSDDFDFSIYRDMYDLVSGRLPGVQIINGEIIIRGNNTINGTSPALIIVDGTPIHQSTFNTMSPANVKSITAIKDGTSAIYGSKGSNGVIVIETKSGGD